MEIKEFKILVLPLRQKMMGLARKILTDSNDAEDAVQDVMMKLWYRRQELDDCRNLESFVLTILHNTCIDMIRVAKNNTDVTEDIQLADSTLTADKILEEKSEIELIRWIIDRLPDLQKTTIKMKDIEGYENEEIAEITGSNVVTVRSNLSRARKKVRDTYLQIIKER
jgi:RNA polymerase sigma-70 factor (ECF subfamily)